MFDNPTCKHDNSDGKLKECIETLPNRADKNMGSIIFYPWYGLETLIEQYDGGNYYKYPYLPAVKGNPYHKTDDEYDNDLKIKLSLSVQKDNAIIYTFTKPALPDENNQTFIKDKLYGIV